MLGMISEYDPPITITRECKAVNPYPSSSNPCSSAKTVSVQIANRGGANPHFCTKELNKSPTKAPKARTRPMRSSHQEAFLVWRHLLTSLRLWGHEGTGVSVKLHTASSSPAAEPLPAADTHSPRHHHKCLLATINKTSFIQRRGSWAVTFAFIKPTEESKCLKCLTGEIRTNPVPEA